MNKPTSSQAPAALFFGVALLLLASSCTHASRYERASAEPLSPAAASPTVRVEATGEVQVTPDLPVVDVSVESRAPTAEEAAEENARRTASVISVLEALELPEGAIETRGYDVRPEYGKGRPEGPPRIEAYRVENVVSVRVDELERVGSVIDRAIEAGADRVSGLRFELSDPGAARAAALAQAVENGRSEAEVLAEALGGELGEVLEVSTLDEPMVGAKRMDVQLESLPETPILPAEQTITARVRLVYSLK